MRKPTSQAVQPRRYAGRDDFLRMQDLLITGRRAQNGSYYVHTGDLSYWLYYLDVDQEIMNHAYLWEDPHRPGELLGWALLTPEWRSFDVFIRPELRASPQAEDMYRWGEERITEIAAAFGRREIYTIWISASDEVLAAYLQGRGFERNLVDHIQLSRTLKGEPPNPVLPGGYEIRHVFSGEGELRAAASYASFQSSKPWEAYLKRYQKFMHSLVYEPEHDLVVVAPDGRFASFCLIWMDKENKIGLFEPFGTHPDFQRLGLGKALMLAGLQRMQAEGMQAAIVNTDHDNLAALSLYRSVGFHASDRLCTYVKRWT